MAKKKSRIGSNPLAEKKGLGWIKDTREGKQSMQSKQSIQSTQDTQSINIKHKSTTKGLPSGWIRHTAIIREEYLNKLKSLAYWERKQIKEVIDEALSNYLKDKKVKPAPSKAA